MSRKKAFPALIALVFALALLASCSSTGGRSVTAGGKSVKITEYFGEPNTSYMSDLSADVSVNAGDTVMATFEYEPDAVIVMCYPPDGGEPVELSSSVNAFRLTFSAPDISGECGFNINYTIDGTLYNLAFMLNVAA